MATNILEHEVSPVCNAGARAPALTPAVDALNEAEHRAIAAGELVDLLLDAFEGDNATRRYAALARGAKECLEVVLKLQIEAKAALGHG
jgi:hypothetical protein